MIIFSRQSPPPGYYVYAYIRNKDSNIAKAGTPYYIGKGSNKRAWEKHNNILPKDGNYIVILESNLTEVGALALERRMIHWYGRVDTIYIDKSLGILYNRTDGGDGVAYSEGWPITRRIAYLKNKASGKKRKPVTEKTKAKISEASKGRKLTEEHKAKIREFVKGRPRGPRSIEHKNKLSIAMRGNTNRRGKPSSKESILKFINTMARKRLTYEIP